MLYCGEAVMKEKKSLKQDIILISAFVLIGLLILLFVFFTGQNGKSVEVSVDGKTVGLYDLNTDRKVEIQGLNGKNYLVIENGEAYMEKAECPDGLCVNMGKISRQGQSIICLPNKVVVKIVGDEAEESSDDIDIIVK